MRPGTPYPVRQQTPRPRMGTPMVTPRLPQGGGVRPRALATPQMNGSFGKNINTGLTLFTLDIKRIF